MNKRNVYERLKKMNEWYGMYFDIYTSINRIMKLGFNICPKDILKTTTSIQKKAPTKYFMCKNKRDH